MSFVIMYIIGVKKIETFPSMILTFIDKFCQASRKYIFKKVMIFLFSRESSFGSLYSFLMPIISTSIFTLAFFLSVNVDWISIAAANTPSNSNATNLSIPEQFRDVIKMNDYLTTGRRQEFWEEPFTRRVMDAIKSKELEMKTAAEILGVSYGTLYGRYRDSYGCLKHPYR